MAVEKQENQTKSESVPKTLLEKHVAFDTLYDSTQFKNASKCHSSTRKSVLDTIAQWAGSSQGTQPIFWVNGASGVGKSAVARTVLSRLMDSGYPATSFFLSWTSPYTMRKKSFAATIVYQIAQLFPAAWPAILSILSRDPELFKQSTSRQFQTLVIPAISETKIETPLFVVIDGLDEFYTAEDEKSQHCQLLDELAQIVLAHPSIRILVTSRPEPDITAAFQLAPLSTSTTQVTLLDGAFHCPETRILFEQGFEDLRRTRCLESSWPSPEQISQLVVLCQGSFISAATALGFICSPSINPSQALQAILQLPTSLSTNNHSSMLDAVYAQILQAIPPSQSKHALSVLEIICFMRIDDKNDPLERIFTGLVAKSPRWIEKLLHLPEGGLYECLQTLDVILQLPARDDSGRVPIYLRHSSFRDFILNPGSSGRFSIDEATSLLHLQIDLMKHVFIILSEPRPESGYDERAVVKIFLEGLSNGNCPPSKELKLGIEAHMNRSDEVYHRYLEAIHMEHLGPKRRLRLNLLITPKEELEVLRYLQRCNNKDLEPSSWRRWIDTLNLQPQIALLASALD